MTSRRTFLLGLGAALVAPAIVRADSLMKIVVPRGPLDHLEGREVIALTDVLGMDNTSIWMVEWGTQRPFPIIRGKDWISRVITLTDADRQRLGFA